MILTTFKNVLNFFKRPVFILSAESWRRRTASSTRTAWFSIEWMQWETASLAQSEGNKVCLPTLSVAHSLKHYIFV